MNKSNIEWCDYTWNPVTGCFHGCNYCYADKIAIRFSTCKHNSGFVPDSVKEFNTKHGVIVELSGRLEHEPFPYGFVPTFHRYRLNEPQKPKKPAKIFVCSMADLFGDWVFDIWIGEVFSACKTAPQHTYIFLTKNPARYLNLLETYGSLFFPARCAFGATVTNQADVDRLKVLSELNSISFLRIPLFVSFEPLLGEIGKSSLENIKNLNWVIIGAQTGPGAKQPKPEWVQSIIDQCRVANVPVFLKDNLNWPDKIQEWPEGLI